MISIIVQARMGSTRLPGKVLRPIDGRPMLSYQLERLRRCRTVDALAVATTTAQADSEIATFCAVHGVVCTRGSEHDVLARFQETARGLRATTIVRITADCPLIDPDLIDRAVTSFSAGELRYDYLSNMITPTWPYGMAVEVFSSAALEVAAAEARSAAEREHVTPFIYWRPERFRIKSMTMEPDLSKLRWTVDTPEDFELISRILSDLYPRLPEFRMTDVLAVLDAHPDWVEMNASVRQRTAQRDSGGDDGF